MSWRYRVLKFPCERSAPQDMILERKRLRERAILGNARICCGIGKIKMDRPTDEEVFQRDGFKCVYCDFDGTTFEGWAFLVVDHFKPTSLGGGNNLDNLKTACVICNSMKGCNNWDTVEEARENLQRWWSQMRTHWEKKVKPLAAEKARQS